MGGGSGGSRLGGVGGSYGSTFGACFVEGTIVYAEKGYIPIEQIKAGDMVWSQNIRTGEKGLKKVLNTFTNTKNTLVKVCCSDILITATISHPFWTDNEEWVAASELNTKHTLKNNTGEQLQVIKVEVVESWQPVEVYNFEVEDWHCYYVSEKAILVHNSSARDNGKITGSNIIFGSEKKSSTTIHNQMDKRGWTEKTVKNTVDNPYTTRESTNLRTGNKATVYYRRDTSHVIVDNVTREVVQVSDRSTKKEIKNWVPDKNIIDPYVKGSRLAR